MRRAVFSRRSPPKAPYGENSRFAILIFVASVTVAMVALVAIFPRPVVLPAFSICALAAAACVALAACVQKHEGARLPPSAWNLAGAITLVGCAAAILGEIEAIVEYTRLAPPRSRADD